MTMINPFTFTRIPEIHFGIETINKLPVFIQKKGKTVLLVTGSSFRKNPYYSNLIIDLKKKGIHHYELMVNGEPSPQLIDKATQDFCNKSIDVVVAIGGGSVIDAGKAISAMLPMKESVVEYLEGIGTKTHTGEKIYFIAVPTTSGTGSEATKNAVLSQIGEKGYKKSLRHDNFMPDVALIDPALTLSCPAEITAACGMDAFTQLIEAYTSTASNPITDALAFSGIEKISRSLLNAYKNPNDIQARTDLSYASLLSGICLSQAGLGVVHGFASPIGGYFNIPHGVVCGTLMSACIRKNVERLIENNDTVFIKKFANIGKLFSSEHQYSEIHYAQYLSDVLDNWIIEMKIPRLSKYGIKESDFDKIIAETGNKNNPVKLTKDDLKSILKFRV